MADSKNTPGTNSKTVQTTRATELPIPPNLKAKLEAFQQRLWSVKIGEGALAGLVGLGLSYLLVFILDRFFDTPTLVRFSILAIGFAVPAIGLPLRWHRWVRQQRTLEQIARLLKKRYPRLGDELLGIVELARSPSGNNSPVLVEAAMKQVDQRIADQDFDDAVPSNRYGTWLASSLSVLALAGLLIFLVNNAAENAMARWISPWKAVERYTFAQLDSVPEKVIVPYAENFDLAPGLADSTEWKPNAASLKLPGKTKLASNREEDSYRFDVPPQKEVGELKLRVGDSYQKIEVTPLSRPELTDLNATLRLPDYLRYETDPVIPVRGGTVSIVEGASASFSGTASRELARVDADGISTTIDGATFSTDSIAVSEPMNQIISWSDIHGLQAKEPLELKVVPSKDEQPDIYANQLTKEKIILVDEVVSFDLAASDDFGIKQVGLEWHGQPIGNAGSTSTKGEKPVAAGAPETRDLEARATFSAAREGIGPQTLQVRAFAEDFLPDRPRSYSPAFVLHILSPEDHADYLTQEFGKWFRNAREVYEREQQLYETNRSLRDLSAAELDSPENRRRIKKQASAESSNGRRLESLTGAGRDLVRQATKNDEFDAERLESWATMMRSLEEIAKNRMPSVSDLLEEAARAEGGKASKPGDSKQAKASPSKGGSGQKGEKAEGAKQSKGGSESAPNVANGQQPKGQSSGKAPEESDKPPVPKAPSISDRESSMAENGEKKETPPSDEKKEPSSGALRLPQTTLGSAGNDNKKPGEEAETPAQEKLDDAIKEQGDLLVEFAKVADQLQEILSSLEASTFVKRLKAASRKQTEMATLLNSTLNSGFGLPRNRIKQEFRDIGETTSETQEVQSSLIYDIQTDLEAYYQRKQDEIFNNVLQQMKDLSVVSSVKDIGQEAKNNLNGRSISASEYWADTLDRWAEELVSASECKSSKGGQKDSLPPEIVLEIMKVLQEEMYLRDETREMQSTRPALAPDLYESKVRPLELTQAELRGRIDDIIGSIMALDNSSEQFGKETQLLNLVSDVMRQSRAVLSRPDTGPEAIAAQTEAIELLLQSKRQNKGGGGGGSNPGGGGAASNSGASLTDIPTGGQSGESDSAPSSREVDQSTGKAGRELPEEFRRGLDTYFNALESN
ncbi:MAG: hypothetical protein P1U87_20895 [Verrucomicrobiales bacterium]|nr:hypothetical protein [Verrucomicrobiales bacterium]